jgi:hypothetical protein
MENQWLSKLFTHSTYRLEDFTTEVLAGILCSDQTLLDSFVSIVLKIEGSDFKLETQKVYSNSKINMVFFNDRTLCFLENQVVAPINSKRLERYVNGLNEQPKNI